MSSDRTLLAAMKSVVSAAGINEVPTSGNFVIGEESLQLFPGSVYGFACELDHVVKEALVYEAISKGLSRMRDPSEFHPITGNLYPLYWGKDKRLGARPYEHIGDPTGTGAIRLSTYEVLLDRDISCAVVIVSDNDRAEMSLKERYPDLMKTTRIKQNCI